jgi:hypothetical protein
MNILRFYGSCGHIEDKLISEEEMNNWKKPVIVKSIFGGENSHINEVTTEEENSIVHVHPFRWCSCEKCMAEDLKEYKYE